MNRVTAIKKKTPKKYVIARVYLHSKQYKFFKKNPLVLLPDYHATPARVFLSLHGNQVIVLKGSF